jgi:serine/threonine protein kinase
MFTTDIIERVHEKYFLHRDIKPANFLMGIDENYNKLYLIDFGLSKPYMNKKTKTHIPLRADRNLIGTPRYVSINTHKHFEQSRRDDLESIGYLLIYFLNGSLPWQGVKAHTKIQKYEKIAELKINSQVEDLCKNIPKEFITYLNYCKSLAFESTPDYIYLKNLFYKISETENFLFDNQFDWNIKDSF